MSKIEMSKNEFYATVAGVIGGLCAGAVVDRAAKHLMDFLGISRSPICFVGRKVLALAATDAGYASVRRNTLYTMEKLDGQHHFDIQPDKDGLKHYYWSDDWADEEPEKEGPFYNDDIINGVELADEEDD